MIKAFRIASISLVLFSCTNGISLQSVDYSGLLNDGNSKVWLISRESTADVDITEPIVSRRRIMVFHDDGTINVIPLNSIGQTSPMRGTYYMSSEEKQLTIDFKEESWILKADYITEDSIAFKATNASEIKLDILLKSFPKL
ncbi:MAG: hypothetical protein EP333_09180 [Bacteroidetes bacterium]|nr:MAG: hypothetical protein EP333_09180 [Bacteroidota bacterium]